MNRKKLQWKCCNFFNIEIFGKSQGINDMQLQTTNWLTKKSMLQQQFVLHQLKVLCEICHHALRSSSPICRTKIICTTMENWSNWITLYKRVDFCDVSKRIWWHHFHSRCEASWNQTNFLVNCRVDSRSSFKKIKKPRALIVTVERQVGVLLLYTTPPVYC